MGFINGRVKEIAKSFASNFIIYANSVVIDKGSARGGYWTTHYRYNGKRLVELSSKSATEDYVRGKGVVLRRSYRIKSRKVTKAKYKQYVKRLKKGKLLVKNWNHFHKNTTSNRKKYLKMKGN